MTISISLTADQRWALVEAIGHTLEVHRDWWSNMRNSTDMIGSAAFASAAEKSAELRHLATISDQLGESGIAVACNTLAERFESVSRCARVLSKGDRTTARPPQ